MAILLNILLALFVIVALLMVFVILMQRPKSEGLGAAFGGGVTENLFGAQTTNVLTKATGWLAGMFFVLTFLLSILYARQSNSGSNLRKQLEQTAPPSEAAMPATVPGAPPITNPTDPTVPAVGAPGSVTNPTPAAAQSDPSRPVMPADQAVGATGPAAVPADPVEAPRPTAQPQPTQR
jgi:preprotein translocase subunit SecG